MAFSLFFLGFLVFTIRFPSSSRGLIIAPVTGSINDHNNETPSNPIQQQLDQHALMKQVSILNKQLALLRANQVSNPQATQTLPLENVTNISNSASSLLPQTSTTNSSNKENAPKAPTTGAKRGPKPLPRDPVTGAIIRPRDEEGNLIVKTRKLRKIKKMAIKF